MLFDVFSFFLTWPSFILLSKYRIWRGFDVTDISSSIYVISLPSLQVLSSSSPTSTYPSFLAFVFPFQFPLYHFFFIWFLPVLDYPTSVRFQTDSDTQLVLVGRCCARHVRVLLEGEIQQTNKATSRIIIYMLLESVLRLYETTMTQ